MSTMYSKWYDEWIDENMSYARQLNNAKDKHAMDRLSAIGYNPKFYTKKYEEDSKMFDLGKANPSEIVIITDCGDSAIIAVNGLGMTFGPDRNRFDLNIDGCLYKTAQNCRTQSALRTFLSNWERFNLKNKDRFGSALSYEKIIFNPPATIVLWSDGSRTVVKCSERDTFDPEKGVALCFMKKALGNKGNFNDILKKEVRSFNETT